MLRLHIEHYRAIASADIELHDLTVLTGVNASGKSSLVRLLHAVVEGWRNQEQLTNRWLIGKTFFPLFKPFFVTFQGRSGWGRLLDVVSPQFFALLESKSISEEMWSSLHELVKRLFEHLKERPIGEQKALRRALADSLKYRECLEDIDLEKTLAVVQTRMEEAFQDFKRNTSRARLFGQAFRWRYGELFKEADLGAHIRISDEENVLAEVGKEVEVHGGQIFSPNKSFYIEKPSVTIPILRGDTLQLGEDEYPIGKRNPDTDKIFAVFNQQRDASSSLSLLLSGDVRAPEHLQRVGLLDWRYERADHALFELGVCAEGIKSLASLQILERMGMLDANTLLIIDEPETHLHPQWIVGCAHALVELILLYNVRILVTTHSPYMVRALQQAMVKHLEPDRSCIYLAEAEETEPYRFHFRRLGHDIAPVYRIFNKALDEIAFFEETAEKTP